MKTLIEEMFGDRLAMTRPWVRCRCPFCDGEFVVGFLRSDLATPNAEGMVFHTDPECFDDATDFMRRASLEETQVVVIEQGGADDEAGGGS